MTPLNLINLLTYNGTFNYVSLLGHMEVAKWLEENGKDVCVIEWLGIAHPVLWPSREWLIEKERRRRLEELSAEFKAKPWAPKQQPPPVKQPGKISPESLALKGQIVAAIMAGDMQKATELQQKLKELS